MSELTGLVNVRTAEVGGGFTERGHPFVRAGMELDGTLMHLYYGQQYRGLLPKDIQTHLHVQIEFTEKQERSDNIEEGIEKAHIGRLHLEISEQEIQSIVRITLPVSMYQSILMLGEDKLVFKTIHDTIEHPSKDEITDHVVAYVTRVYFERRHW